jgi:hypothetical protein
MPPTTFDFTEHFGHSEPQYGSDSRCILTMIFFMVDLAFSFRAQKERLLPHAEVFLHLQHSDRTFEQVQLQTPSQPNLKIEILFVAIFSPSTTHHSQPTPSPH